MKTSIRPVRSGVGRILPPRGRSCRAIVIELRPVPDKTRSCHRTSVPGSRVRSRLLERCTGSTRKTSATEIYGGLAAQILENPSLEGLPRQHPSDEYGAFSDRPTPSP